MNKPYKNWNWPEIFENYYYGMTQRELEKKYFPMTMKTIQRTCKMLMVNMMTDPQSILRKNLTIIHKEIDNIIKRSNNEAENSIGASTRGM